MTKTINEVRIAQDKMQEQIKAILTQFQNDNPEVKLKSMTVEPVELKGYGATPKHTSFHVTSEVTITTTQTL